MSIAVLAAPGGTKGCLSAVFAMLKNPVSAPRSIRNDYPVKSVVYYKYLPSSENILLIYLGFKVRQSEIPFEI